jgi:hypothetical protein
MVCLLVIMLWMRSYFRFDAVVHGFADKNGIIIESTSGKVVTWYIAAPMVEESWLWRSNPPEKAKRVSKNLADLTHAGFLFSFPPQATVVVLPHWFLAIAALVIGAVPWLKPTTRFSLRTMFLVTALIAIALGVIAYAIRQ